MILTMSTADGGLRERKKQRTRETIARVAIELFDRQGFHATTIAQIAEAADVSPRTVSAYFPAKEDLVFPDEDAHITRLRGRLADRLPDETTTEALRAWIDSELADWVEQAEQLRMQVRVVASDERLQAFERRFELRAQRLLAEAFARDLGRSPEAFEPRIAAAATLAVFEQLHEVPFADDASREEALEHVDRALAFVASGLRAI